ncbi:MAG: hypothetical protein KAX72_08835 [Chitinophagales bacterium]|jgi:hypothetical protein|nr:hypothetical protein [Bacteroidota bacterium]MBK9557335.1 hypothetical protein [Bacteroidota bacterium]MBP8250195.1 hypothetical protein [Chitinophagales bacterium]MBP9879770.1 hypothetical protein [Chitinophagales bacterium]
MKKIMVMMTVALMVFSTNMFAQTATGDAKVATEKKEKIKAVPVSAKKSTVIKKGNKSGSDKKAVNNHKDELKAKYDSKAEAKEAVKAHHDDKKVSDKDRVKAHKSEIKSKADSKQEAKAKIQRKHAKKDDE